MKYDSFLFYQFFPNEQIIRMGGIRIRMSAIRMNLRFSHTKENPFWWGCKK